MSRALESGIKIAETGGVVPQFAHRDLLMWVLANTFLQSAMGFKQGILNKGLIKFFQTWSQMKHNDRELVGVWHRMYTDGVPSF